MIEAYITNLGRYVEGRLDGEYLKLPAQRSDVQNLLQRIHVDGIRYEEIFITDYKTDIPGLAKHLDEYENVDELNYLAVLLDGLESWELEKFGAVLGVGEHSGAAALINLAQNLDCYEFYSGIGDEEDLGRYYIDEMCALEVPEHLKPYIDYEAYGRDIYLEESGCFVNGGYIVDTGDSPTEHYTDRNDLPEESRIFAFPEPGPSIQKALARYKRLISEAPVSENERPSAHAER
jgi:antirestriction protein